MAETGTRIEWHTIKDARAFPWMRKFLLETQYTAFTKDHRDKTGMRICLVGDLVQPDDEKSPVDAFLGFKFIDDDLADRGQGILEECRVR